MTSTLRAWTEVTEIAGYDTLYDISAHAECTLLRRPGSMWYYFRPHRSGCQIKPEEIIEVVATSRVSTENTTAKFPEYHKVWEDNRLEIVAIFGKYESGGKAGDAGVERLQPVRRDDEA